MSAGLTTPPCNPPGTFSRLRGLRSGFHAPRGVPVWARTVENVSALVAYGVDAAGHRQLLGVSIGAEESERSWSELLTQLCERGLSGAELVVADEHRGLANAVRRQLPEARRQRCI